MRALAISIVCLELAILGALPRAVIAAKVARVPSVSGMTESRAQCALAAIGLRWRFRGDARVRRRPIIACAKGVAVIPDPKILSQSPVGGAHVRVGSVVVLDDACLRLVRQHRGGCA